MPRKSKSQGVKKMRETRAAYRVKRKPHSTKSLTVHAQARKTRTPVVHSVPWENRVAPTNQQLTEWGAWLNEHEPEFEQKYPGHYLAIWDKQIIAVGATRAQVFARADRAKPEVIPLITFVPREEDIIMIPSNFPVQWRQDTNGGSGS